jgi:hypothetical protein
MNEIEIVNFLKKFEVEYLLENGVVVAYCSQEYYNYASLIMVDYHGDKKFAQIIELTIDVLTVKNIIKYNIINVPNVCVVLKPKPYDIPLLTEEEYLQFMRTKKLKRI